MNKTTARKFVREVGEEMMKQGDPIFFTEEEAIKLLMIVANKPLLEVDEWNDAADTIPDDWSQVIACVKDGEGMYSLAAIWNGKIYIDMEDKEELSDVLFWMYLPEKLLTTKTP